MKRKMISGCLLQSLVLIMFSASVLASNVSAGSFDYSGAYVTVSHYLGFVNGVFPLQDKIWCTVSMYGQDADAVGESSGTGYDAKKNGKTELGGVLSYAKLSDSISDKACGYTGNTATLTLTNNYNNVTYNYSVSD